MRSQIEARSNSQSPVLARRLGQADDSDDALLGSAPIAEADEVLIVDGRANLGPAQQVENKLSVLLRGSAISVSHVRMTALSCSRRSC
jgi:hypothetical protein